MANKKNAKSAKKGKTKTKLTKKVLPSVRPLSVRATGANCCNNTVTH
jgi:hypothetical protein